jgi:hypothetical protein
MLLLLTQVFFIWGIHGFLQLSWIGLFAIKWVLFHLENNGLQELFLSQLTQFSEEYNVLDASFLPCMVVFGELHAFPALTWIGLFGAKSAYLHLEAPNFHEVFLSKVNSVITEKQCAASFCFYTDGFPSRDTCVSSSKMNWWICSKMSLFHLENFGLQEVLLSKTFWVSRDNTVLYAAATFTAGFLREIHIVLQLRWIGLFGANWGYFHLERPSSQEVFFSKTDAILTGKQCARCSCFKHGWFSFEKYLCFFNLAK